MRRAFLRRRLVRAAAFVVDHAVALPVEVPVQPRVERRDVVALLVVVDIGLPVALHEELRLPVEDDPRRRGPIDRSGDGPEPRGQRRSRAIQADEDEALPGLHGDREQRERVLREVRRRAEGRDMIERAVRAVAPSVIGALDGVAPPARLRQQHGGPMPADVVEAPEYAVLAAAHEEGEARGRGRQVVAGLGHRLLTADPEPLPGEDALPFRPVDVRIAVPPRGHGPYGARPHGCVDRGVWVCGVWVFGRSRRAGHGDTSVLTVVAGRYSSNR